MCEKQVQKAGQYQISPRKEGTTISNKSRTKRDVRRVTELKCIRAEEENSFEHTNLAHPTIKAGNFL